MYKLSIRELSDGLRAKKLSSRELTQHFLKRVDALEGQLNSHIHRNASRPIRQAGPTLPPRTVFTSGGFFTGPNKFVWLDEPSAISSMLALPSSTMPAVC